MRRLCQHRQPSRGVQPGRNAHDELAQVVKAWDERSSDVLQKLGASLLQIRRVSHGRRWSGRPDPNQEPSTPNSFPEKRKFSLENRGTFAFGGSGDTPILFCSCRNRTCLNERALSVELMGRGFAWLDTGTHESLIEANQFVQTVELRRNSRSRVLRK